MARETRYLPYYAVQDDWDCRGENYHAGGIDSQDYGLRFSLGNLHDTVVVHT